MLEQFRCPFTVDSFFPSVSSDSILDIEFSLEYHGHIHRDFNKMDFPEFVALYEKLVKQLEMEKNDKSGNGKSVSMNDMMSQMNTGREE